MNLCRANVDYQNFFYIFMYFPLQNSIIELNLSFNKVLAQGAKQLAKMLEVGATEFLFRFQIQCLQGKPRYTSPPFDARTFLEFSAFACTHTCIRTHKVNTSIKELHMSHNKILDEVRCVYTCTTCDVGNNLTNPSKRYHS